MELWFAKYAAVAPIGALAFTLLLWTIDGQKGLAALSQYVELGVLTFAAFLAIVDEGVAKVFYSLEQIKRRKRSEAQNELITQLQALAEESGETEALQRLLRLWEQKEVSGQTG